jgi:hypothetical protein
MDWDDRPDISRDKLIHELDKFLEEDDVLLQGPEDGDKVPQFIIFGNEYFIVDIRVSITIPIPLHEDFHQYEPTIPIIQIQSNYPHDDII